MNQKKVYIFSILIVLMSIVFIIFYKKKEEKSKKYKKLFQSQLRNIEIEKVVYRNTNFRVSCSGRIYPNSEFHITPDIQSRGIVEKIFLYEGAKVSKGKVLMVLNQEFISNESFNPYKVRSPYSGVISDVHVELGDKVNSQTRLFSIVDIRRLKVKIDIPEKYLNRVKKGQKVIISLEDNKKSFIGKVDYYSPVPSFNKRKPSQVIVLINNSNFELNSGIFVDATIFFEKKNLLLIPMTSIIYESNSYSVFVYDRKKKKVFLREIKVGNVMYNEGKVEVLDGLTEGEFFLTRGQFMVFDEESVNVVNYNGNIE
uniref:RND family efflux transporter MFP subunit n=1 Tax=uncultured spirochete TaxID=156406 RepID=A0A224AL64_9SPIR|nr:RND family efflux transporter MFP subunit [uncultured spirochete]